MVTSAASIKESKPYAPSAHSTIQMTSPAVTVSTSPIAGESYNSLRE